MQDTVEAFTLTNNVPAPESALVQSLKENERQRLYRSVSDPTCALLVIQKSVLVTRHDSALPIATNCVQNHSERQIYNSILAWTTLRTYARRLSLRRFFQPSPLRPQVSGCIPSFVLWIFVRSEAFEGTVNLGYRKMIPGKATNSRRLFCADPLLSTPHTPNLSSNNFRTSQ